MAQNLKIANALYEDVPSISIPTQNGGEASFVDTTDADAVAEDILQGKTAYVNGAKVTGTGTGNYLPLSGGTLTGPVVAPSFQTGTDASHYFQCRKFRGEGNANTYYHAIDFGYGGHNQVDFYEYGGLWNFYKSTDSGKAGSSELVGSIKKGLGWNGLVKGQDITTYAKKSDLSSSLSTIAPTGCVQAFAGRTTPQGWLLCDGSAYSRTDYAALFAVIGTTYGAGNGSTTFNLPNLTVQPPALTMRYIIKY